MKEDLKFYKECFDLDPSCPSGVRWKFRPRSHFQTDGAWKKINSQYSGKPAGTKTRHGYWQIVAGRTIGAHRVVWSLTNGKSVEGWTVDHIDGNGLNNDPRNLRRASLQENSRNRKVSTGKAIPLKGVEKSKGKYRARIYAAGTVFRLGTFKTPEEAHAAYCDASKKIHLQFGRTA